MTLRLVSSGPELGRVRALFEEYAESIGVDLCFQGFAAELAGLPGDYVAPDGALLLAEVSGEVAGCVAVRRWDREACEMKRLYVRPAARGRGCGLALAERAIEFGVRAGYRRMLLDTLPSMTEAQALYARLGFRDIAPYRDNPIPGARYMAVELPRA